MGETSKREQGETAALEPEKETEFSVLPRLEKADSRYIVHVGSKEDAHKIVRGFWGALGEKRIVEKIDSGIIHTDNEITAGIRTIVSKSYSEDTENADYKYNVIIVQNAYGMVQETEKAVEVMRQNLGF